MNLKQSNFSETKKLRKPRSRGMSLPSITCLARLLVSLPFYLYFIYFLFMDENTTRSWFPGTRLEGKKKPTWTEAIPGVALKCGKATVDSKRHETKRLMLIKKIDSRSCTLIFWEKCAIKCLNKDNLQWKYDPNSPSLYLRCQTFQKAFRYFYR